MDGGHRGGALSGKCKDAELVVLASWVLFMTHRTGLGLGVESRVNSRQSTKESPLNSDCPAMYQRLFSFGRAVTTTPCMYMKLGKVQSELAT